MRPYITPPVIPYSEYTNNIIVIRRRMAVTDIGGTLHAQHNGDGYGGTFFKFFNNIIVPQSG